MLTRYDAERTSDIESQQTVPYQCRVDHAFGQYAPAEIGGYHYLDGFQIIGFQDDIELLLITREEVVYDFASEGSDRWQYGWVLKQ